MKRDVTLICPRFNVCSVIPTEALKGYDVHCYKSKEELSVSGNPLLIVSSLRYALTLSILPSKSAFLKSSCILKIDFTYYEMFVELTAAKHDCCRCEFLIGYWIKNFRLCFQVSQYDAKLLESIPSRIERIDTVKVKKDTKL